MAPGLGVLSFDGRLIVGVSCLLCSSAVPGVWSFLRVALSVLADTLATYIAVPVCRSCCHSPRRPTPLPFIPTGPGPPPHTPLQAEPLQQQHLSQHELMALVNSQLDTFGPEAIIFEQFKLLGAPHRIQGSAPPPRHISGTVHTSNQANNRAHVKLCDIAPDAHVKAFSLLCQWVFQ